jgi:Zn-finger nucleic acid-binding protein
MDNRITIKCPACEGRLYPVNWHGTELDICNAGCYGIWFDYGELQAVEQSDTSDNIDQAFVGTYHRRPVQEDMKAPERHCPQDNKVLTRYEWNVGTGLVMDSCPQCHGIWLDAGELKGFVGYIKRFREEPPTLDPMLQARMASVQRQVKQQYDSAIKEAALLTVPWDIAFLDDVLRGVLKFMVRQIAD